MQKKIDTFLIGAQKSGTTSIYDWLGQHPEVAAPKEIKDYHFFSDDRLYSKGLSHLTSFYSGRGKKQLHCAVNYMFFHNTSAERISEYNPDSKIIVCLRDPVKRAASAYKYFVRTLRENGSLQDALVRELNKELSGYEELSNNTYIGHGKYFEQLSTYLNYFENNQIHVVWFEELTADNKQEKVMQDLCDFLEIDNSFKFQFTRLNASNKPKSQTLNFLIRKSGLTKLVKPFLPFGVRKKLSRSVEQWNISKDAMEVEISPEAIRILNAELAEDYKRVRRLLSSNFPDLD